MKIDHKFIIELLASGLTLTGMAIGSSTQLGNAFYIASSVFWIWLMFSRKLWGLLPLNVVMPIIEIWHLIK